MRAQDGVNLKKSVYRGRGVPQPPQCVRQSPCRKDCFCFFVALYALQPGVQDAPAVRYYRFFNGVFFIDITVKSFEFARRGATIVLFALHYSRTEGVSSTEQGRRFRSISVVEILPINNKYILYYIHVYVRVRVILYIPSLAPIPLLRKNES